MAKRIQKSTGFRKQSDISIHTNINIQGAPKLDVKPKRGDSIK